MVTFPFHLEVKEGAKPKHNQPCPVLKIYEITSFRKEVKRLCKKGALKNMVILHASHPTLLFYRKI